MTKHNLYASYSVPRDFPQEPRYRLGVHVAASLPIAESHAALKQYNLWEGETLVTELVPDTYFVNIYLHDQAYGGPEEGGWYYPVQEACECWPATLENYQRAQKFCEEENADRRSDINSVLSEGCYGLEISKDRAKNSPTERPHYE